MSVVNFHQHLTDTMKWHFSAKTGSHFWLEKSSQLDFDPIKDIHSFSDLSLFPDVSKDLREVAVEDLKPRGVENRSLAGIFESGGTTGKAKRVVAYEEWLAQVVSWRVQEFNKSPSHTPGNTLAIIPGGPHIVGAINLRRARALGGHCFAVDLDPRWVKRLVKMGELDAVKSYSEHLVEQAEPIITTQTISYLVTTPPLLQTLARYHKLVEHLNQSLKMITWGGTYMDIDTLDYLKTSVFPGVTITASYGSTMILSETKARLDEDYHGSPIFDSFAPYVLLEVVDPTNGKPVAYHERGRVIMNHLSKFALFPNILERDTAVKLPTIGAYPGAAVAEVKPVMEVSGHEVIEGVY